MHLRPIDGHLVARHNVQPNDLPLYYLIAHHQQFSGSCVFPVCRLYRAKSAEYSVSMATIAQSCGKFHVALSAGGGFGPWPMPEQLPTIHGALVLSRKTDDSNRTNEFENHELCERTHHNQIRFFSLVDRDFAGQIDNANHRIAKIRTKTKMYSNGAHLHV